MSFNEGSDYYYENKIYWICIKWKNFFSRIFLLSFLARLSFFCGYGEQNEEFCRRRYIYHRHKRIEYIIMNFCSLLKRLSFSCWRIIITIITQHTQKKCKKRFRGKKKKNRRHVVKRTKDEDEGKQTFLFFFTFFFSIDYFFLGASLWIKGRNFSCKFIKQSWEVIRRKFIQFIIKNDENWLEPRWHVPSFLFNGQSPIMPMKILYSFNHI